MISADELQATMLPIDRRDFDIGHYISSLDEPYETGLQTHLEQWRDRGIVIFKDAINSDDIEEFLDDIDFLTSNPGMFDLEVEYQGSRYRLNDLGFDPLSDTRTKLNCLEIVSLAARKLSLNRFVCEFLKHVFQSEPCVLQSLTFWRGSNQPAHIDYPYVRTQTKIAHLAASWIPLEDIHPDSGPLAYYPGSHRQSVVEPFDWGDGSIVLEEDSSRGVAEFSRFLTDQLLTVGIKKEIFLPKKGDALIWHGNLVHEGTETKNDELTRKSYVTHYTSRSAHPPLHRFSDAFEKKRYTYLNHGFVFDVPWAEESRVLPSWRSQ